MLVGSVFLVHVNLFLFIPGDFFFFGLAGSNVDGLLSQAAPRESRSFTVTRF